MPGVNYPNNERFAQTIADLHNRVRALETQQQLAWSNALGQILITLGLVPGSDPAEYGFQLLNPATGAQIAFLGEDSSGNAVFDVTGTETVSGELNVTGNETVSGTLNVTGNTVIGGNLSVPNGSITNDALANPVSFQASWADTNSSNLSVAGTFLATASITVPTGFSTALVTCYASVGDTRTAGAGGAPFYTSAWIGGPTVSNWTGSTDIAVTCADGASAALSVSWVRSITGLTSGQSIQAGSWGAVDSTTGWVSGAANGHTTMVGIFLR